MKYNAKGVIQINLPRNLLEVAFRALFPEVISGASERCIGKLKRDGDIISLEIKAEDTVALRAALNSYLRWLKIIYDINELV